MKLPDEVTDAITLASLKEHRKLLKDQLRAWRKNPRTDKNPNGVWMHPEDVGVNKRIIESMTQIIKYYGG